MDDTTKVVSTPYFKNSHTFPECFLYVCVCVFEKQINARVYFLSEKRERYFSFVERGRRNEGVGVDLICWKGLITILGIKLLGKWVRKGEGL